MANKKVVNEITSVLAVVGGAVLLALTYQLFVVENGFAPAGLNGIATMIQYKTGFSIGYMSIIINIPFCIFAYFLINKRFASLTLTFCLVYSFAFLIFQKMGLRQFQYCAYGHNTIYPVILSGMIAGFVYGICFGKNASTGGTDIVSKYISFKKPSVNFFWVTFIINAIVAAISFFVYAKPDINGNMTYDYSPVCLCVLYCFISSFMGNYIIKGTRTAIKFTIITKHPLEIAEEISRTLHHSSTKISAVGSYNHDEQSVLICVINKHQIVNLKDILKNYDNTFSFSETVTDTYGNFKVIK